MCYYRKQGMTKYIIFLTISILIIFPISGCSPLEGEPHIVLPHQSGTNTEKPAATEPNEAAASTSEEEGLQETPEKDNNITYISANAFFQKSEEFLKTYVNSKGLVDYQELRRKRFELNKLLDQFNKLDPNEYKQWSPDDKKAFWINIYNLQKLKVVTDNYPIESSRILRVLWGPNDIRHIEGEISQYKFLVMDEEFTFKKIEDRFFKKEFRDPRIFLALTDACMSSPPLRNEPYYGQKLDEQLNDQAKKFLSSPLALKIEQDKGRVYLSALFEPGRFGKEFLEKYSINRKFKDFQPEVRAVLNFICKYVSKRDVTFLEVGNYSIHYMTYDWTINDSSR
jgi:hypothetical protein